MGPEELALLAQALHPVPRNPFSEFDEERLGHRDLDGCTASRAWRELAPALIAQQACHDDWREERIRRLMVIAKVERPKRSRR